MSLMSESVSQSVTCFPRSLRRLRILHFDIAVIKCLCERIKLAINFVEEVQVVCHFLSHLLCLSVFLQVGKLVAFTHALVQVLDLDFLDVAIFALASHLLGSLLLVLGQLG